MPMVGTGGQTFSNNQGGHNQHKGKVELDAGKPYEGDVERLFQCSKCGDEKRDKRVFPYRKGNYQTGFVLTGDEYDPRHGGCGGFYHVVD